MTEVAGAKDRMVERPDGALALIRAIESWGATHVIWLPSTESPRMHQALRDSRLVGIPVCREGEAIPIAAGLYAGGKKPVVAIQNTGFLESGDSVRGLAIPLGIPLPIVIAYRGYKKDGPMTDTAAIYIEPILKAWGIKYYLVNPLDERRIQAVLQEAWDTSSPVVVLLPEAEGRSR